MFKKTEKKSYFEMLIYAYINTNNYYETIASLYASVKCVIDTYAWYEF